MTKQQNFRSFNSINSSTNNNRPTSLIYANERLVPENSYACSESSQISRSGRRFSSVRNEWQIEDEFARKQRIIRYMEEEKERSERMKLLSYEQECWTKLRTRERVERLRFLSLDEVTDLMRREAAGAELNGSSAASSRYTTGDIAVAGAPLVANSSYLLHDTHPFLSEEEKKTNTGSYRGSTAAGTWGNSSLSTTSVHFNPHMNVIDERQKAVPLPFRGRELKQEEANIAVAHTPQQPLANLDVNRSNHFLSRSMESNAAASRGDQDEWTSLSLKQLFRDLMVEREHRKELEKKIAQLVSKGKVFSCTDGSRTPLPPMVRQLKADLSRANEALRQQKRETDRLHDLLEKSREDRRENAESKRGALKLEQRVAPLQRQLQERESVMHMMKKHIEELEREVDDQRRELNERGVGKNRQGRGLNEECAEHEAIISNLKNEIRVSQKDQQYFQEKARTAERERDLVLQQMQQFPSPSSIPQEGVIALERRNAELRQLHHEDILTISALREALRVADLEKQRWSENYPSAVVAPDTSTAERTARRGPSHSLAKMTDLEIQTEKDRNELQYWKRECEHLRQSLECSRKQAEEATKNSNAVATYRFTHNKPGNEKRVALLQQKLEDVNEKLLRSEERVKLADEKFRALREQSTENRQEKEFTNSTKKAKENSTDLTFSDSTKTADSSIVIVPESFTFKELSQGREASVSQQPTSSHSTFHMEVHSKNPSAVVDEMYSDPGGSVTELKSAYKSKSLSSSENVPPAGKKVKEKSASSFPFQESEIRSEPRSSGIISGGMTPIRNPLEESGNPERKISVKRGEEDLTSTEEPQNQSGRQSPTLENQERPQKTTVCC